MVNQLNKFSLNLADHMKPLHELLSSRSQWRQDETLPATDHRLQVVRETQDSDAICTQIKSYCQHGWPDQTRLQGTLKKYLPVKDELSVTNGLLLRGNRVCSNAVLYCY